MIVTPRDINVLQTVANLSVATAAQLRRLCFPADPDGRITRRRLQMLVSAGLLARTRMEVVNPLSGMNAPVYYSMRKGLEFLAIHFEEPRYLALSSQRPQWQHLAHGVAIAEKHILVDQSAAREKDLCIENWTNEFDVVNKEAEVPEDRYRLYCLLSQKGQKPRLVCNPDFMFVIRNARSARIMFGELERGTTHPEKAAALKSPGYAELARRKMHRRFCEDASESFWVLVTAPDARWRDQLVKAFSTRPEPSIYRFAAWPDLTPETFFRGDVWHQWWVPRKDREEDRGKEAGLRVVRLVKTEPVREPVPMPAPRASGAGRNGVAAAVVTTN